ncbi:F0F1 ATP synthase subunit B [Frankia sp. Mgl5]|uniref:ATP synthase subunit b n=2 Tax=Parafrankia TaxID=2994362 RepID=ATPF_PARS2|nr:MULTISPECIES: F0F1 ATP synthase subunit B [Frankiaceae]A8L3W1.1 RecName: Full=ATP synthase subunit b; AltName: Full=ATP synthase F(0) sector subunit b; AltName: Full=ATPase subunit I; AltName: Full=F-type ATPase subunit b; Short=F-ATPase subunit b [Frankia sp. EAN1pec]ABW10476.1 ATP synthase F0, B subunit [Frankia sp. EAN1pec]MCK9929551.1 F0F1 ATP synthase subunit B [Frankia sp. Mgl5]OHV46963.1 F0F1 ATP synthase subunit B [Parafrankia soli]TCJ40263.1 F0F1 ATP synthase subunit B [Parafrankia
MLQNLVLAAAEEGAEHEDSVLVPPLAELIVGLLAFGLLVGFFFWKIYPQIRKTYAERAERIEGGLNRAERAEREAQALLEQYRSQLAEARSEAARIREDAQAQGRQIVEELRTQVQQEVAEIRERADAALVAERAQVVASVRREIGEIALELATRIVGRELENDTRQRQLVDDFIAGLDEAPQPDAVPAGPGV